MKRLVPLLLLLTLLSPLSVRAQGKPDQQTTVPKLVETVNVRVINVDVVVTDRKGNPIRGLKEDDFQLYENGRLQKITNFYEVRGTTLAATATSPNQSPSPTAKAPSAEADYTPAPAKRKYVFFIDNLSLAPFHRNTVFRSMKEFVKKNMGPDDQAMIATFNHDIKTRLDFTNDSSQILQTLDIISGESAFGTQNISERRDVQTRIRDAESLDAAIADARSYASSVDNDLRQTVNALNGLMTTLAGIEGKKILILTSEGMQMSPGREMFVFVDDTAKQKGWASSGSTFLQSMNFNATSLIQSVARSANANGITIYTMHGGGLAGTNENSAENQKPVSVAVQQEIVSNSTDSLIMLADMTGGAAATSTNNFDQAFRRIASDVSSYYSLGYSSPSERVDRQRDLDVRTRNRNYIIRARKTYVEKSVDTDINDRLIANLFYAGQPNDMKIFVTTGRPVALEVDRFKVPVEIHIPMESITFLPQGEILRGGLGIFMVVANAQGDTSEIQHQTHPMTLDPASATPAKLKDKYYTYAVDLVMEKGRNRISVGILDEATYATGFQRQEVLAADLR
ncbi:MAG TPA: VWA domain-containing protein [Thermoanaerobaculia bacterium]|nr:VWA domain-containing protein [Thermoanaerobaculia bacterium]